ncbi:MAG: N-acetylglucosamine kinase [Oscillospiraceae bacterium]
MYVIGIDGGGTKTRMAVCAPDGTLLRRETLGAFNLSAIGEDGFRRRTEEILALCGDMRGCGAICVGGAGVSGAAAGEILRAELAAHGFAGKLLLCGDHEIALAGAMQTPGCVLIAGTGSVCYGKNTAGEAFRCGGGGHIIDDPGSGYTLGRDALAAALRTEDGRLSENALHAAVMDAVGGHDIQGIFDFVYFSRRGKSDIAALAPLVLRCAEQGDAVSLAILRRGATELARLVSAVTGRLGLDKKSPCALAGGLLAENNIYRRTVCEALVPFCRPAKPEHGALFGAVQLALAAVK